MIFIITGPSGVGKNTIINELSNHIDFHFSTSYTTRPRRDNEIEGQDYYFITHQRFNDLIDKNHMLEYEEYGGYFYGTPKSEIDRDGIVIFTGKIKQLKRFKEDANEVKSGYECGISIEDFNDIKVGDIIESFEIQEIKRKL